MPGKAGVFIHIAGDVDPKAFRQAQAELAAIGKATDTVGARMRRMGQQMSSIGKNMSRSVTLPIIGIAAASVKAFADAEAVAAQTRAVIKSTGAAANVTAGHVDKLASAISRKTGIDDEAIATAENLLLTFTNVRNGVKRNNRIFDEATRIMVDMGVALKNGPEGAAIQLGKALNDPIKGISALSRVGVTFTEKQKKTIASLMESGKRMKAQKIILRELRKEFGGSAAAFGETTAGRIEKLKVAFGNLGEEIGAVLLPVVEKLGEWIQKGIGWFQGLSPEAKNLIAVFAGVAAAVGPLLVILGALFSPAGVIALVAGAVFLIIQNWDKVVAFFKALPAKILSGLASLGDGLFNLMARLPGLALKALANLPGFLMKLGGMAIQALGRGIVAAAPHVWSFFRSLPGRILGLLGGIASWLIGKGVLLLRGLRDGIVEMWSKVVAWFKAMPGRIAGFFVGSGEWLFNAGVSIIQGLWNGMKSLAGSLFDYAAEMAGGVADAVRSSLVIRSPSRVFIKIGQMVVAGMEQGLSGMAKLADKMQAWIKKALDSKHISSATKKMIRELGDAVRQLSAHAAKLQEKMKTYRDAVAGGFSGSLDVTGSFDPSSNTGGGSVRSILQDKLQEARAFASALQKLAKRGLDRDLLRQIAEAGPTEGLAVANQALSEGVAGINRTFRQIEQIQARTSRNVAGTVYTRERRQLAREARIVNNLTIKVEGQADSKVARKIRDELLKIKPSLGGRLGLS